MRLAKGCVRGHGKVTCKLVRGSCRWSYKEGGCLTCQRVLSSVLRKEVLCELVRGVYTV